MDVLKGSYRRNDPVYLDPRVYDVPKEYFKLIVGTVKDKYNRNPISLVDVGCASGGFIHYAKANLNITDCVGIDISEKLTEMAQQKLPDVEFKNDSIDSFIDIKRTFDVCTCLGTLGIFDEIEQPLKNLLDLLKKGGSLFIFGSFNEYPVDVITRYRVVKEEENARWESGLNITSMVTIERLIKKYSMDTEIKWIDVDMPFHLPKQDNPMRQWTMETSQKKHQVVVGTGQLLDKKIVQVIKK